MTVWMSGGTLGFVWTKQHYGAVRFMGILNCQYQLVKGKETKPVLVSIGNPTVGLPIDRVKRWAKSRKTHGFIAF